MSRLDVAVQGVPAGSPPDDDQTNEPINDPAPDPQPEGQKGIEGGEADGDKGRTIENVRGELLRKQEKSKDEIMAELVALRNEMQAAREQYGVPAQTPAAPQTLDDMNISQLEAARANVPEENLAQFDAYLLQRKVDAKVEDRLNEFQQKTQNITAEQRFNEQAVDRWPQLRDKTSELYRKADKILSEMGTSADSPRAVLDAANEAGLELGITPATGLHRARREPGRVAPGRRTSAPASRAPDVDTEQQAQIAKSLANAMPGKTFTPEQLKRIAQRDAAYREQISQNVRG